MKSKKTKKIISVSTIIKKKIITLLKRDKELIEVIPNGVDISKFNLENRGIYRKEILKKHNLQDDDFILLFIGYYHLRKGLQFLVEAMSLVKNPKVKVLVVGDDPGAREAILPIIKRHRLEQRIIYTGNQPEVFRYFSSGDTLVLPTIYEPFGNVVLEAMACGLPVIVTKSAGVSDLIIHRENGLLINDAADIKDIADNIIFISNNETRRKEIARKAKEKSLECTWDIIAEKTLDVFKSTITTGG